MRLKQFSVIASWLLLLVLSGSVVSAQDKAPDWLTRAASTSVPSYDVQGVPAVQLLNEESVTISNDGTVLRTVRRALKVLERGGREEAIARVIYQTDSDKVRSLSAWLIKKGVTKEYGKKEVVDIALTDNDLYNEARSRFISAEEEADAGDVFGFESTLEEKTIFSQFTFAFQYDIPSIQSRFSLTMPTGWKAESVVFNATGVTPSINGSNYVWEMRDLKPIPPEPAAPEWTSLAPRLSVSVFPTASTGGLRTFASWNEVAKWMAEIEDPQANVNDALAAKAQDLVKGLPTEHERIRAISRYVQAIQYISIQVGVGRGGGYTPRLATDVFSRSYGDCKDKANLMRAMLKVLKIDSYLVSITADDPMYVRPEWPSPHQFNHCIIAIKVSDATQSPAVVTHSSLGRLLIFDPTDPYTPLDDLPMDEQGSWALIDHRDTTELTRMPVMPASTNRVERTIQATLSPFGEVSGNVFERSLGQSARFERSRRKRVSEADYKIIIDRWISRGAAGATTTKIEASDDHQDGKFDLRVDFAAPRYGQLMQGQLMVFKPAIIGRLDRLSFKDGKRHSPYMIEATSYSERAEISLPVGFKVDEMPESSKVSTEFGTYSVDYKVEGGKLIFSRSLTLNRAAVPIEKYDTVKSFFGRVHAAEQSPVVLLKQ